MPTEENPHAGTGSVLLDIGGDVGALVVVMPAVMDGLEVEIIPTGTDTRPAGLIGHPDATGWDHPNDHSVDGNHNHSHHDHNHSDDIVTAPPHVAVVARPTPNGSVVHSLVYGSLAEGTYDLYVRPFGAVHLSAKVVGGEVTEVYWN